MSTIIKHKQFPNYKMCIRDRKYIDIQMDGFKRMGVVGDWEHPYKTMDPGFEDVYKRQAWS